METPDSLPEATLEVVTPEGTSTVSITASPFEIGRGGEGPANRLALDDTRVSRRAGLVVYGTGGFSIRDLGQRKGLFLNDQVVEGETALDDGDVITFGNTDAVRIVFRLPSDRESITSLLERLDESARSDTHDPNLQQLSLLLEATALLQTRMPIGEVLAAMVDQAIRITAAQRGALFEADAGHQLRPLASRQAGGGDIPVSSWIPSQTAIDRAVNQQEAFIELDLDQAGESLRKAQSIVDQRLRSVIAIPLYSRIEASGQADPRGILLGLLYLDSRLPAAFRGLGRQVLAALAIGAASVLDNARMVERERERLQMDQDLAIARDIQQKLLPKELGRYHSFQLAGINKSCHSVGGDYFDVVELAAGRVAFVVADVTGKGLPAALLAAMLQGGFAGLTLTPDLRLLVSHVNRYVWGRSEPNRFATAFVGVLDRAGQLEYISAGHLPAFLIRKSGATHRLASSSFPIGVFPDTVFTSARVAMDAGDTLVVFTDGLTEATNAAGEEFGMVRLEDTLRSSLDLTVDALETAVLDAVGHFSESREPEDDMTLLIVRYAGDDGAM